LATIDGDGFLKIVDRKKDLIITSGFNVYPGDVEAVLRQFPGIRDVAVVGVPNVACGELVKAVLVLEPEVEFHRAKFDAFCKANLAAHKRPKIVELASGDLPRNFLGKVLRRELRHSRPEDARCEPSTKHESQQRRREEALAEALRE
jgi:long-chain acyl-CoA synthetase